MDNTAAEQKLTKEVAKELVKIKGEARGVTLKTDWDFILLKKGKEGLEKLEAKMAELGFPIKHKEIKVMNFYPIGMDAISMLAIKELFNFDEKDFEELGAYELKLSFFLKIFLKYFSSLQLMAKEAPKAWQEHYTVGKLQISEINEEKAYIVLRIENFNIHPLYCFVLKGYFSKIIQMAVKTPVTCQETKCPFKGDKYHEFLIKW